MLSDEQQAGPSTNTTSSARKRKRTSVADSLRSPKRVAGILSSDTEEDITDPESDDENVYLFNTRQALPAGEALNSSLTEDDSDSDAEPALQYIDVPPSASTSESTSSQPLDSLPQSPSPVPEGASTFQSAAASGSTPSSSKPLQRDDATPHTPDLLTEYTCPICFSPPSNATMTPCGHICCGSCLFTAVKTTMQRGTIGFARDPNVARCPVCRAPIPGWDGRGGGVFGLKPRVVITL